MEIVWWLGSWELGSVIFIYKLGVGKIEKVFKLLLREKVLRMGVFGGESVRLFCT